ncbi:MAG TPA: phosphoribosylpyrophosphate synthetase [Bacteroidia bacterium]|nr:phosphoribosylpyrophosphate synthetase [Bacteroidia bacterium]
MNYATVLDALNDLKKRGYTIDFNLQPDCIKCDANKIRFTPDQFEITEVYRFEGESNPSDESVVYAIKGKDGSKGVLVSAYGMYSEELEEEMIKKLQFSGH